jgi:hypothetical protein
VLDFVHPLVARRRYLGVTGKAGLDECEQGGGGS